MISRFFTFDEHATLLEGAYHFPLVVLSLLVAMFASFMAFNVAEQAAVTKDSLRRNILLGTGSVALGGGIWSMHFLGMTAFELCTPVSYSATLTGLSALPGVAAAWVALYLLTKSRISAGEIVLGGVLVGSGIGTMHYSGMAAMEMAALLRYDLTMFAFSIVIAVLLAMLALWIKFGIKKATKSHNFLGKYVVLASVIMGGGYIRYALYRYGRRTIRFTARHGNVYAIIRYCRLSCCLYCRCYPDTDYDGFRCKPSVQIPRCDG